ncbi:MAG: efflux RND transporter periplasmic adaptor subunit [Bacteroidota bacterium]
MDRIIEKKRWTLKKISGIIAILALFAFILYLIVFRDNSSKLYIEKENVTIATVEQGNFQEFIPLDGIVYPKVTIYLDAVFGGRVEEIYVRDGEKVERGQPILKLSNATIEMDYMYRENNLLEVLNNYQNTRLSLERNTFSLERQMADLAYEKDIASKDFHRKKELYESSHISEQEFEDAQREYNITNQRYDIAYRAMKHDSIYTETQMIQIKESIDRMEDNLQMLKSNLENLIITAPVIGQLSSFNAEIGESKQSGENLGQIDVLDGFKIKARVDERYVSRTYIGQPAQLDYNGEKFDLTIQKIYSDITGGAFEVDLLFEEKVPDGIRRGQTIPLRLQFSGVDNDALIIPRGAFYQQTGGNWIYVLNPQENQVTKRTIEIGRQNIHHYEVREGLMPGEKVIVSSYDAFGNKDKLIFK